ncbi:GLPGLI family protein [Chryseobacterium sp. MMS23-Vi53]|uniref:GLPGLI family protein n=1 Tax=Chryseobacterium sp. MMS23-Vi53 TaxID=3386644 RepID=UPI0039E844DA
MNRLVLVLILISSMLFSQENNYAFGYRLTYKPDSTDIFNTKSEDFTLFVNNEKSYFLSDNFLKRDSAIKALAKAQSLDFTKAPKTRFKYIVLKSKKDKNLVLYDNILKYYFSYPESPEFNWKLSNETMKIGNLNCSKAETVYAGRTWVAWYTKDIPVNDGPYKFNNLPGLIIKVSDSENNFDYELISIKKSNLPNNQLFQEVYLKKHKEISREDYLKTLKNINDNIINEAARSGLSVAPESVELVKANLKKRNNPIELK